jgi:hypothetical protein
METSDQISADLGAVLHEKHENFELLNSFKGVPVICRARLLAVQSGKAHFNVKRPDSAILKLVSETLLLSDGILEPIEAQLNSFNIEQDELILEDFCYASAKLFKRKDLRVQPEGAIQTDVVMDETKAQGTLVDISMRGAGVRIKERKPGIYRSGAALRISVYLPESSIELPCKIRSVTKDGKSIRLGLEFVEGTPEKTPIVRYIMRRRSEIFAELWQMYPVT